jgi:large subunit ribosomal protein L6
MSRIGKQPITLPAGVTVAIDGRTITVKGPLGEISQDINSTHIDAKVDNGQLVLTRSSDVKEERAKHGLYRALLANNVKGVHEGFNKTLIVNGVGFKCAVSGNKLTKNLGYSHPEEIIAPEGITLSCTTPTEIKVTGIRRDLVGHVAANIKASKKIEPYHGYGIRYSDEIFVKKEGKTAASK